VGKLFLLFTVVPLIELSLLLFVGAHLGLGATVALVLFTGLVGAWLAKSEGLRVFRRWQEAIAEGRLPEEGVLSGLMVLVGGVFLITPGVLTDVLGFALMLPASRRWIANHIRRRMERQIETGSVQVFTFGFQNGFPGARLPGVMEPGPGGIIDVQGEVIDDHK